MGGKPITALNIACFPINVIEEEVFNRILLGGLQKMTEAGVALLGGHSIDDKEIKYGLSVTGICDINKIYSNRGAKPGDILCLTKKLGTGFVVSAISKDFLEQDTLNEAELSMAKLNKYASELAVSSKFTNAMTDITGFGLAGHLSEMMIASDTCCEINLPSLPVIGGTMELINKGVNPAGTKRNREYFSKYVLVAGDFDKILLQLAFGAETSGGLIFAVPEVNVNDLKDLFVKEEEPLYEIGRVLDKNTDNDIYINFL